MRKLPFNGTIGGFLIAALLLVAGISLLWTPYDPMKLSFAARLTAPSAEHWLGTDKFGRDVLMVRFTRGIAKSLRKLERVAGIEPAYSAWKAAALPLSYTRGVADPVTNGGGSWI